MKLEREKKTKATSMVFTPSLFENFQKIAYMRHMSVTGLMEELMRKYVSSNTLLLKKFDELNK